MLPRHTLHIFLLIAHPIAHSPCPPILDPAAPRPVAASNEALLPPPSAGFRTRTNQAVNARKRTSTTTWNSRRREREAGTGKRSRNTRNSDGDQGTYLPLDLPLLNPHRRPPTLGKRAPIKRRRRLLQKRSPKSFSEPSPPSSPLSNRFRQENRAGARRKRASPCSPCPPPLICCPEGRYSTPSSAAVGYTWRGGLYPLRVRVRPRGQPLGQR